MVPRLQLEGQVSLGHIPSVCRISPTMYRQGIRGNSDRGTERRSASPGDSLCTERMGATVEEALRGELYVHLLVLR